MNTCRLGVGGTGSSKAITLLATTTVMTVNVAQATIDALDILLGTAADQGKPARARLWRMVPPIGSFAVGALAGAFGFALFGFAYVTAPIVVLLALFALLGTVAAGRMPD